MDPLMFSSMLVFKDWFRDPSVDWRNVLWTIVLLGVSSLVPRLLPPLLHIAQRLWAGLLGAPVQRSEGSVLLLDLGESLTSPTAIYQDAVLQYVRAHCEHTLRSVTSKRGVAKFDPGTGQRYFDLIYEPDEPVLVPFEGYQLRVHVFDTQRGPGAGGTGIGSAGSQTGTGGARTGSTAAIGSAAIGSAGGTVPVRASSSMRLSGAPVSVLRRFLAHCQADGQRRASLEHGLLLYRCDRDDRSGSGSPWVPQPLTVHKTRHNVFVEQKDAVFARVDAFVRSQALYERHGQPYKHTLLLSGEPGTGKTSLVLALARHLQRHIYWFGRETDAARLHALVDSIPSHSLVVLDDMDIKFDLLNRDAEAGAGDTARGTADSGGDGGNGSGATAPVPPMLAAPPLPFPPFFYYHTPVPTHTRRRDMLGAFLEVLDAYSQLHGCLVVITTNRAAAFDRAVLRHGRIDQHVQLGRCSLPVLQEMLAWYYPEEAPALHDDPDAAAVLRRAAGRYTPARLIGEVFAPLVGRGRAELALQVLRRMNEAEEGRLDDGARPGPWPAERGAL